MKKKSPIGATTMPDGKAGHGARGKHVGALVSGLTVLRYLTRSETAVGATQVARDLGLNTSTCFNLLNTLVRERLVIFHPETKDYSIGLGFIELAKGVLETSSCARFIRPLMNEIVADYSVTATLWQRSGEDRVVLIERVDSAAAIRVHMTIGQRLPAYVAALGRVLAAHSGLSRAELRKRFTQIRWQNPPSFDDYYQEVEKARECGYAVDEDRYVRGVTTISAPIFTEEKGVATLALSAAGFSGQFSKSLIETIGSDLCSRTQEISQSLTGSGNHSSAPFAQEKSKTSQIV